MANSNNTIEVVEVFTRSRRVIPIPWMERIPQRNLTLIAFTLRYEISASQMIANTARSAPKIMHVHCSQGDIGNMNDIMHMKRAISFAAKHTASFFAALNNSISDNILSLERFITASFAQIY